MALSNVSLHGPRPSSAITTFALEGKSFSDLPEQIQTFFIVSAIVTTVATIKLGLLYGVATAGLCYYGSRFITPDHSDSRWKIFDKLNQNRDGVPAAAPQAGVKA